MKKKILIVSIFGIFMLVAISFASAVTTNTINDNKKDSPLYRIRTKTAIREKINKIIDNIKTRFLGERVFFVPFYWIIKRDGSQTIILFSEDPKCTTSPGYESCAPPC
jgi:hypothetical protein